MATEKAKPLMTKKAARAAAEKEQSAKKSTKPAKKKSAAKTPKVKKPAKPAKAKGKKQKTVKPAKGSLALIPAADIESLNREANANEQRLKEMIPEHVVRGAEIFNVMQDHTDRQLWKYGDTPYASKEAFLTHYAELAKISTRTLKAVVSANKFLPGVTAETKKKIGPRKLKKVVAAVKKHRAKTGNPAAEPPGEIIDAAINQPEAQFDETLRAADLAPDHVEPKDDGPILDGLIDDPVNAEGREPKTDPLLHHEPAEQPFRRGKKGASGAVEGEQGTAQQFGSVVEQAVTAMQVIEPELAKIEALERIAWQWLKFPCVREDLQDMTNEQAAEHLLKAMMHIAAAALTGPNVLPHQAKKAKKKKGKGAAAEMYKDAPLEDWKAQTS